jgi:hypothetical protein
MGYDINSFFNLCSDLPKFQAGTDGQKVLDFYTESEQIRLPVEAFIGIRLDSTMTKLCRKQIDYILLYRQYKEIVKIAQNLYKLNSN